MNLAAGVADLHVHTSASDGTSTVLERVQQASGCGLEAIAITDHDSIPDSLDGAVSRHGELEVITGVEVRAGVRDTKIEILGYYVDPDDEDLIDVLERTRQFRRDRNRVLVENVNESVDVDLDYERLSGSVDGMLGRPHIADELVRAGIVDSIGEAFETYLGTEGSAYVPMERLPASAVVNAIQSAGGVASLAHPGRIRSEDVEGILEALQIAGIDAIEVKYPYDDAPDEGYAPVDANDAAAFADTFELLETGGSDCHGPGSGKFRFGDIRVGRDELDAIRELAEQRGS